MIYTGSYSPDQHNSSETTGNYQTSNVDKYLDTQMNNVTLQYHSGFGLEIGGDYTHYKSDNHQSLMPTIRMAGKAVFQWLADKE